MTPTDADVTGVTEPAPASVQPAAGATATQEPPAATAVTTEPVAEPLPEPEPSEPGPGVAEAETLPGAEAGAPAERAAVAAEPVAALATAGAAEDTAIAGTGGGDRQPLSTLRSVGHGFGLARARFRAWRRSRPFWAGLWALLGGVMIAAGPASAYKLILASGTAIWLGILVGVVIAVFGLFFWFAPSQRQIVGVLTVIAAVASFVTSDLGGFLVGMLLAMTGGALGFAWVPAPPRPSRRERRRARKAAVLATAE